MPLPLSALVPELLEAVAPESMPAVAAAVLAPLVLASVIYLDARRRLNPESRGPSLAPLAWSAAALCSGLGCVVVAACYAVVRGR